MHSALKRCLLSALAAVVGLNALAYVCERFLFQPAAAPVRFVVISKTAIPAAAFTLSSIPLAVASYVKYGRLSFAIVPAVWSEVEAAFRDARFLVIGTHGRGGGIGLDDYRWVAPDALPLNPRLETIYFGACEAGSALAQWQTRYPKARVIGHEGLTDPLTGWFYLVFQAWRDLLDS